MRIDETALKWWYEMTPDEMLAKHRVVKDGGPPDRLTPTESPFQGSRFPLDGQASLTYQLALSDLARCLEARLQRAAHPELPLSGDHRSGVIVFDEDKIVASFILDGRYSDTRYSMAVLPEYRIRGLGRAMMVEWGSRVKRLVQGTRHPITERAKNALLAAHAEVVRRVSPAPVV